MCVNVLVYVWIYARQVGDKKTEAKLEKPDTDKSEVTGEVEAKSANNSAVSKGDKTSEFQIILLFFFCHGQRLIIALFGETMNMSKNNIVASCPVPFGWICCLYTMQIIYNHLLKCQSGYCSSLAIQEKKPTINSRSRLSENNTFIFIDDSKAKNGDTKEESNDKDKAKKNDDDEEDEDEEENDDSEDGDPKGKKKKDAAVANKASKNTVVNNKKVSKTDEDAEAEEEEEAVNNKALGDIAKIEKSITNTRIDGLQALYTVSTTASEATSHIH